MNDKAKKHSTRKKATLREKTDEDEFMAAAIGDVEWLKQSVSKDKAIQFDRNVSLSTVTGIFHSINVLEQS